MRFIRVVNSRSGSKSNRTSLGATMVEFSLTFIVVTFVLFLLVEFALWIHCYNTLADAAKAGVRYAIVHGSGTASGVQAGPSTCQGTPTGTPPACPSDCSTNISPVQSEVTKWAGFSIYSTSAITVNVCYLDGTNVAPGRVRVTVSNGVTPFFGFVSGTPPVTAAAQGRIVN